MAQTGSWCLNPKIKIRNASVFRVKTQKRWVLCGTLCSQTKHPPQSFSLTFKGAQDHKVKVKIKKNVLAMKAAAKE